LREQTEEARVRGIFGAPTFFVGTEMFWGNDRLDDALLWASQRQGREPAA
jgi:2-hydroxychromene-2-carboxylate isomerase